MTEKSDKNKGDLKITQQSRIRSGMVYDLKYEGSRLNVRVFPRENPTDSADWRVEARTNDAAKTVVTEWGATRTDALREVGRSWASIAPEHGLPTFDWEAVAQALVAVKAL